MFSIDQSPVQTLLDVGTIYYEPTVMEYARGQEILARFPNADLIEVPSHWQIEGLHGNQGLVEDWVRIKRTVLVLGVKKSLSARPNGRSSDFIAPSHANGCTLACAYCVAGGTMIATPEGERPVEQVAEGETIFAYDVEARQVVTAEVAHASTRSVEALIELQVGSTVLRASADHPVMTKRGWVAMGDLVDDDQIVLAEGRSDLAPYALPITRREQIDGETTVYNFHVPGPESFIANSVISHNCFVPRRKGYANPITTFVNIEQITRYIERHAARQGMKLEPNQVDPALWVYEIGENNDCSVDASMCNNVRDLVALFRLLPNAKATFATKYVNRALLDYDPQGKTRVRFSLMPQNMARVVDVRAAKIDDRINAINDFVDAGYEVHVNFAPVIIAENWLEEYAALFAQIDDTLSPAAKAQLKAEVIFLTHNEQLHEVNMRWHPKAETLLWRPEMQETKNSENGMTNVRYRTGFKGQQVRALTTLLNEKLPYCEIRYAF